MMEKQMELRNQARSLGLALLIYWAILNIAVLLVGDGSGWGYLLALALSFFCYTRWKTPAQFQEMLWRKEQTMTFSTFLGLFCLVTGAQLVAQLSSFLVRLLAIALDIPMEELVRQASVDAFEPAMFLYACILGPLAEELLFRGLVLRTLAPFGKKLAIFVSALLFGLFHGNLLQTPYAFVMGLVLGYGALQYRLVWTILLHVGNNLLFACVLPRLLAELPSVTQGFWIWTLILVSAYAAGCLLLSKAALIRAWLRENRFRPGQLRTVFTTGTVLAFLTLSILNMIAFLLLPLL